MSINFIPNDPLAITDLPTRQVNPRPDRAATVAGLNFSGPVAALGLYAVDTPEFLYWQSREACLAAIEAWESFSGSTLKVWQGNRNLLLFHFDAGNDLNAYYDRKSLSFYHASQSATTKVYYAGASTDTVAHETGHGILDSFQPDFWNSSLFEVNSFHEAFGDCVALLTALNDQATRAKILANIASANFVEAISEELCEGVKQIVGAKHNAAVPRHAKNLHQYVIPSTLPEPFSAQDGPGVLIHEEHSFSRVFTGCFYDTILNIFNAPASAKNENALLVAAQTAGKLLYQAATQAPQKLRFFREIGRAMVLADRQVNAGTNESAIRSAFEGHDIPISLDFALSPEIALDGKAPALGARASLVASARKDLMGRLGAAPGAKSAFSAIEIGAVRVGQLVHQRAVELGGVDQRLTGVVAMAAQTVLLGHSGGRAAVLGALPQVDNTDAEVRAYIGSLVKNGAIDFAGVGGAGPRKRGMVALRPSSPRTSITHAIRSIRGQKTLVRLRFACGCGSIPVKRR